MLKFDTITPSFIVDIHEECAEVSPKLTDWLTQTYFDAIQDALSSQDKMGTGKKMQLSWTESLQNALGLLRRCLDATPGDFTLHIRDFLDVLSKTFISGGWKNIGYIMMLMKSAYYLRGPVFDSRRLYAS